MSGIGSRVLLALEVQGYGNGVAYLNEVDSAMRRVNTSLRTSTAAQSQLGRTVSYSSALQTKGMRDAAQATFRYTFYALMALRAGQAIASRFYIRGLARPAEDYEQVWTRISATLQVAKSELADMQGLAFQMTRSLPFIEKETGEAILEMGRAGMRLADIKSSIVEVGRAAMVAEVGLADAGIWVVQMLNAYSIKAERAGDVTNLLAYYSNEATYSAKQLMDILAGVGGSAAAMGQNIAQVMQLATAFGKMGTAAGEADTLIRQLYMNAAKPDVYEAMKYGLDYMGYKPMYDEYGNMSNLGEAFLGFSKFLDEMLQSTAVGEERAAMAAKINEAVFTMFGVRSSRAFFQIAKMDPEAFKALYTDYNEMVEKSTEYTDEYIAKIEQGYQYSKRMAAVARETFMRQLGTPMLSILRPLNQVTAQFSLFGSELLASESGMARLAPMFLFLTTSAIGLAGAVGIAAGAYLLLKMRMADVGQGLLDEKGADWLGHLRGKGYMAGIPHPTTAQIGFSYFRSIAAGPLKALSSTLMLGGMAYLMYRQNLLGFQKLGERMSEWWKKNMTGPQTIAIRLAERLKKAATYTDSKTSPPLARFIHGIKQAISDSGPLGLALRGLKYVAKGAGQAIYWSVIYPIGLLVKVMEKAGGWFVKWGLGWGSTERGLERLGWAIGAIVDVWLIDRTIRAIRSFGESIMWLLAKLVGKDIFHGGRVGGFAGWTYRMMSPVTERGISSVYRGSKSLGRRFGAWMRGGIDESVQPEITRVPRELTRRGEYIAGTELMPSVIRGYAQTGPGGLWAPRNWRRTGGAWEPVNAADMVPWHMAGNVVGTTNLQNVAANADAYRGAMWLNRLNYWPRRMTDRLERSWQSGYLNRARHPISTVQSWWAGKQIGAVPTSAQASASWASGAIGRVGMASGTQALMAVLPYLIIALIGAGIISMIISAIRGGGSNKVGTVNNINVSVANANASAQDIANSIAATLDARERSKQIATVESNARNAMLQSEGA